MRRLILLFSLIFLLVSDSYADTYRFKMNAHTKKQDWVVNTISSDSVSMDVGVSTQVLFSDAGAISSDADYTWTASSKLLSVSGDIVLSNEKKIYFDTAETKYIQHEDTNIGAFVFGGESQIVWLGNGALWSHVEADGSGSWYPGIDLTDSRLGLYALNTDATSQFLDVRVSDDIRLAASNENDYYVKITTTGTTPEISTYGGVGPSDLKITSSGGTIDFDDDTIVTTGIVSSDVLFVHHVSSDRGFVSINGDVGIDILPPTHRLHVPWLAGDLSTTAFFGSTNAANDQPAITANSYSNYGLGAGSYSNYGARLGSTTGGGAFIFSDSGVGLKVQTTTGVSTLQVDSGNATAGSEHAIRIYGTGGAGEVNMERRIQWYLPDTGSGNDQAGHIGVVWTDPSAGDESSDMDFWIRSGGVYGEVMSLANGIVTITDIVSSDTIFVHHVSSDTGTVSFDDDNLKTNGKIITSVVEKDGITSVLDIQPDAVGDGSDVGSFRSGYGLKLFKNADNYVAHNDADNENPVMAFYGGSSIGQVYGTAGVDDFGRMVFGGTTVQTVFDNSLTVAGNEIILNNTNTGFIYTNNTASGAGNKHITFGGKEDGVDAPTWVMTDRLRQAANFGVNSSKPQLWLHDGSTTYTNLLKLHHDGTGGNIEAETGNLNISADSVTVGDGGTTDFVLITASGDTVFVGGAGLVYGSLWQDEAANTVTISTISADVPVDGFTTGEVHLVAISGDQDFLIERAGRYEISWNCSFNLAAGNNNDVGGSIGINKVRQSCGSAHRRIATGTDTGNMGAPGIFNLSAGDTVQLMLRNETGTNDILVDHANIVIHQVGG